MNDHDILVTMLNRDPDGMPSKPTDAARDAFRTWAIDTYGSVMWARYMTAWQYA